MAEVEGRCGRRKQRNPRRKNAVENEEPSKDPSLAVDVDSPLPSKKRAPSSDNNTITTTTTTTVEENSEEKPEDKKENSLSFSNTNFDPVAKRDDLPKGDKPAVKESTEREEKAEEDVVPTPVPTEKDGEKAEDKEQEEKKEEPAQEGKEKDKEGIEKMLASGDTVVIYPEPVSDHDDTENQEDMQTTTEEEYILKCVHCSETFTRASLLRDHMRSTHPDLPVKYQCPKCDETFPLKSHLDKHLALHSPPHRYAKCATRLSPTSTAFSVT